MLFSAKHRVMLWIPCLIFIYLVMGTLERSRQGDMAFRIYTGGFLCSVLIFVAALLITRGERTSFYVGLVCWILSILSLLLIDRSTLIVIHF
jgi:hypothetical protein